MVPKYGLLYEVPQKQVTKPYLLGLPFTNLLFPFAKPLYIWCFRILLKVLCR